MAILVSISKQGSYSVSVQDNRIIQKYYIMNRFDETFYECYLCCYHYEDVYFYCNDPKGLFWLRPSALDLLWTLFVIVLDEI